MNHVITPLTGLLLGAVFVLDHFTPLGLAVWALYLIPLLLTFWSPIPHLVFPTASAITAGVSYEIWHVQPLDGLLDLGAANRLIWIGVTWGLAVLIYQYRRSTSTNTLQATITTLANEAIIVTDLQGRITTWNAGAQEVFQYPADDMIGKSISLLTPPDQHAEERDIVTHVMLGQRVHIKETTRWQRSGYPIVISLHAAPLTDPYSHTLNGILYVIQDITEHRRQHDIIQEQHNHLHAILHGALDAVISIDEQGLVTRWNAQAEKMFGWTKEEVMGKPMAPLIIPPEHRQSHEAGMHRFHRTGQGRIINRHVELTAMRRNGDIFPIELTIVPVKTNTGHYFTAFISDITERKRSIAMQSHLAAIVSGTDDAIVSLSLEGNVMSWNPSAERVYGYPAEEMIGRPITTTSPPHRIREFEKLIRQVERGEAVIHHETVQWRKDGQEVHISMTASPIRDDNGNVEAIAIIVRDITSRKRSEEAMIRLATIVENSTDAIIGTSLEGTIIAWNRGAEQMYGYLAEEIIGMPITMLAPPEQREEQLLLFEKLKQGTSVHHYETVRVRRNGDPLHISIALSPIRDPQGRVYGISIIARDITERKISERDQATQQAITVALAESESLHDAAPVILQTICEQTDWDIGVFWVLHPGTHHMYCVDFWTRSHIQIPQFETITRAMTLEKGIGLPGRVWETRRTQWAEDITEDLSCRRNRVAKEENVHGACVFPILLGQELLGMVSFFSQSQRKLDPHLLHLMTVIGSQIGQFIERKRVESAHVITQKRLLHVLENSPIGVITWTKDGYITDANPAFLEMTGYSLSDLQSHLVKWTTITPPEYTNQDEQALLEIRETGKLRPIQKEYIRKDGSRVPILLSGATLPDSETEGAAFIVDLTEYKQLEAQLRQSQKMEAIGRLAGGVSHDFNNLLTVISGYTYMLLNRFGECADQQTQQQLEAIREAGERASNLTKQLLTFSRQQVIEPRVINLNTLAQDTGRILRRLIGEDIRLITSIDPNVGHIRADIGQLEQVVMNLAVNARDAMPYGGKLMIETGNIELAPGLDSLNQTIEPGPYAHLIISDTGTGMDKHTIAKIFDPFFTTKPQGKGTGLGLSIVYGIIQQCGGKIFLFSELGKGTTFKIFFPIVDAPVDVAVQETPYDPIPGGSEKILLLEDDLEVRRFARAVLESNGYSVYESETIEEAFGQLDTQGQIDLLITDVIMPGPSGKQIAESLMVRQPSLKVLFMSGYTADIIHHHGVLDPGINFLQKPFNPRHLAKKVRDILGSTP